MQNSRTIRTVRGPTDICGRLGPEVSEREGEHVSPQKGLHWPAFVGSYLAKAHRFIFNPKIIGCQSSRPPYLGGQLCLACLYITQSL